MIFVQSRAQKQYCLLGFVLVKLKPEDYQWSLQLVDRLIHAGEDPVRATEMKSEILLEYADDEINCPTRHYYIQCSKE